MSVPPFDAAESIEKEQVAMDFEPKLGKVYTGSVISTDCPSPRSAFERPGETVSQGSSRSCSMRSTILSARALTSAGLRLPKG